MKIYLIRHGETYANVEKRYVGFTNTALTEKGKGQIKELRKKLSKLTIKKAYCSPSTRTKKTAELLGLNYETEENLREMNFGILEGMTYNEIMEKKPEVGRQFFSEWESYQVPGGESYLKVRERVKEFINILEDENTLVVTHGGWIRAFLAEIEPKEIDIWNLDINVGCLIEVEKTDDLYKWKLI